MTIRVALVCLAVAACSDTVSFDVQVDYVPNSCGDTPASEQFIEADGTISLYLVDLDRDSALLGDSCFHYAVSPGRTVLGLAALLDEKADIGGLDEGLRVRLLLAVYRTLEAPCDPYVLGTSTVIPSLFAESAPFELKHGLEPVVLPLRCL